MTLLELNKQRDVLNDALNLLAERPAKAKARLLEIEAEFPELVLLVARGQASAEMLDSLALERTRLNAILSEPTKRAQKVLEEEQATISQKRATLTGAENAARNLADFKTLFNEILSKQSLKNDDYNRLSVLANSVHARDSGKGQAFQIMVRQLKAGFDRFSGNGEPTERFAEFVQLKPLS